MNWAKCWCELWYVYGILFTMPFRNNLVAQKKDDMNLHVACDMLEKSAFRNPYEETDPIEKIYTTWIY